jgi:hypothetical protein
VYSPGFFRECWPRFQRRHACSSSSTGRARSPPASRSGTATASKCRGPRRCASIAPTARTILLYWQIHPARDRRGLRVLDFGRSTPNEGTFHFKKQWGAEPSPLYWEYILLGGEAPKDLSPKNPKFGAAIAVWKRLPVSLTTALGPHIVRSKSHDPARRGGSRGGVHRRGGRVRRVRCLGQPVSVSSSTRVGGRGLRVFWLPWLRGPATWSISDLVSNVLLFIPIGVFLTAAADCRVSWLPPSGGRTRGAVVLGSVVTAAFLLSAAVEFAQAFRAVPHAIGGRRHGGNARSGARRRGVAVCAAARRSPRWPRRLDAVTCASLPCRMLLAYCAVFAVAWLLPLDFTLRPREIADKYQHKRPAAAVRALARRGDRASSWACAFRRRPAARLRVGPVRQPRPAAGASRRVRHSGWPFPALIALESASSDGLFDAQTDTTALLADRGRTVAGASSAR